MQAWAVRGQTADVSVSGRVGAWRNEADCGARYSCGPLRPVARMDIAAKPEFNKLGEEQTNSVFAAISLIHAFVHRPLALNARWPKAGTCIAAKPEFDMSVRRRTAEFGFNCDIPASGLRAINAWRGHEVNEFYSKCTQYSLRDQARCQVRD